MANVHLPGRRSFAFLLSISMLAPLTACKKSSKGNEDMYSSGKIIQATDPYFLADVNSVKIPEEYGMILECQSVNECVYTGQYAIVSYYQEYKIPEDIKAKVDSGSDLLGIDLSPYYVSKTSIFDKEGKFIKDIGGEKDGRKRWKRLAH